MHGHAALLSEQEPAAQTPAPGRVEYSDRARARIATQHAEARIRRESRERRGLNKKKKKGSRLCCAGGSGGSSVEGRAAGFQEQAEERARVVRASPHAPPILWSPSLFLSHWRAAAPAT